ncbi:hypothetical protein [Zhihengliuella salsuginis]|uniref:PKD domain-containing protein n=1 Tax=Zhihengliuella salsuginis TaxID=578222 RepID=A0ABQ3GEU9_9MICC|nr:hypothetical protein [Zhihengliuella salsuginis]GHD03436.1 hypothetical protein GCM10008096_09700 [Zhihengliuella salsuginis]
MKMVMAAFLAVGALLPFSPGEGDPPTSSIGDDGKHVDVGADNVHTNTVGDGDSNQAGQDETVPIQDAAEVWETYDPYCRGKATMLDEVADFCFGRANSRCDEDAGETYYQVRRHTRDNPDGELTTQTVCLADDSPLIVDSAVPEDVITVTTEEFRTLPIPSSEIVFESPVDGHEEYGIAMIGQRVNQWAGSSTHVLETTVLGTPVEVRATPLEYQWTYGDGHHRTTQHAGGPRPEGADPYEYRTYTDNIYEETGNFEVNLTTVYTGEFRHGDSGWIPISGVASVPSDPKVNSIWKRETRNVSADCIERPEGWACESPFLKTPPWEKE